jgi:hypothetical protein
MDAARLEFRKGLAKTDHPASLKIVEVDGELQLTLSLTIQGAKVNPTQAGDKRKFRDAILGKELLIQGRGNVELRKISNEKGASKMHIYLTTDTDTKIPGTGDTLISAVGFEIFKESFLEAEED